jgi:CRISPR-associated protein Cas2
MFTVISYDVADDRRRRRVLALLKGYGRHVQESVFECDLSGTELAAARQGLRDIIEPHADDVRFYFLDRAAVKRIRVLGRGRVTADPRYYLVGDSP